MKSVVFEDGFAVCGSFPSIEVLTELRRSRFQVSPKFFPLTIADPPYGKIAKSRWDKTGLSDKEFAAWMIEWTKAIELLTKSGGALYVWGGVGLPRNGKEPPFRPFLRYLVDVEHETGFSLSTPLTWKKRRAYGIQWGYLFTREECAYLVLGDVKKPRTFHVPLLDEKRGYEGYDENYPAKSEFLRRTNVWTDVTEIMRGKVHEAQKPLRLMEIPIETHTERTEFVFDPFAGSGTTALAARKLGRRFIVIEKDPVIFDMMVARLRGEKVNEISGVENAVTTSSGVAP